MKRFDYESGKGKLKNEGIDLVLGRDGYFYEVYEQADPDEGYVGIAEANGRRDFFKKLGIFSGGIAGGLLALRDDGLNKSRLENFEIDNIASNQDAPVELLKEEKAVQMFHTQFEDYETHQSIKGYELNPKSLYGRYLGNTQSSIPETLRINFSERLENMWRYKINRYKDKTGNQKLHGSVIPTFNKLYQEYIEKEPSYTRIDLYSELGGRIASEVRQDLDWNRLARHFKLNGSKLMILQEITKLINGPELIAYVLTELMPSHDGKRNKNVLDFMLHCGGREYVESIPAQGDPYTSFGPFQFTHLALADYIKDGRRITEGASTVNRYVSKRSKIPGSVSKLRGDDHFRAAMMFVIYNLLVGIRSLEDHEFEQLRDNFKDYVPEIVQYIATAHHKPSNAHTAFSNWLGNKFKNTYWQSCDEGIREYAGKTKNNYQALT